MIDFGRFVNTAHVAGADLCGSLALAPVPLLTMLTLSQKFEEFGTVEEVCDLLLLGLLGCG
jgi:hypothetical protein